jgi:hypothetical protein
VTAIVKALEGTAFETSLHTHTNTRTYTHKHRHTHTHSGQDVGLRKFSKVLSTIHLTYSWPDVWEFASGSWACGISLIFRFFRFVFSFMSGSWAAGFRRDDVTARARCVSENHQKALCCLL